MEDKKPSNGHEQDREPTGNPEIYDYDPDYVGPESRRGGSRKTPKRPFGSRRGEYDMHL
jgi:hypothetical protein